MEQHTSGRVFCLWEWSIGRHSALLRALECDRLLVPAARSLQLSQEKAWAGQPRPGCRLSFRFLVALLWVLSHRKGVPAVPGLGFLQPGL